MDEIRILKKKPCAIMNLNTSLFLNFLVVKLLQFKFQIILQVISLLLAFLNVKSYNFKFCLIKFRFFLMIFSVIRFPWALPGVDVKVLRTPVRFTQQFFLKHIGLSIVLFLNLINS